MAYRDVACRVFLRAAPTGYNGVMEIFDAVSVITLFVLFISWRVVPPTWLPILARHRTVGFVLVCVGFVICRKVFDSLTALSLIEAVLLASIALTLGEHLLLNRRWPARAFPIVVGVLAVVGADLRAERLNLFLESQDAKLYPDVEYYKQQAKWTMNPWAAGWKSPLWPALNAPLVRTLKNEDTAIRLLSWAFGVALIPAIAVGLAGLFGPIPAVICAAVLAVDSFLIDLCCQGLREEMEACLWILLFVILLRASAASWTRVVSIGILGGVMLLLRNLMLVPYGAIVLLTAIQQRWPIRKAVPAFVLPILIVSPFYVNQYRIHGDALAMEKRDARYHANLEFGINNPPPGLSMPTQAEFDQDLYAGEPLAPSDYLFRYHSLSELCRNQIRGLWSIISGNPFTHETEAWLPLFCIAGLIAACISPRHRIVPLFIVANIVGIRAHLYVIRHLDQRHLIQVMIIWLTTGWWLITLIVQVGGKYWLSQATRGPGPQAAVGGSGADRGE